MKTIFARVKDEIKDRLDKILEEKGITIQSLIEVVVNDIVISPELNVTLLYPKTILDCAKTRTERGKRERVAKTLQAMAAKKVSTGNE